VTNEHLKTLRQKAMSLPLLPGVYIMKNKSGEIIYIGKAKKLKNRVSQYFGAGNQHNDKVKKMVSNVEKFEYIICDTEFEALVLECSLIKQHSPKYNILLKDDKGYHYIKITGGDWPNITASFDNNDKSAEYIGPFLSGYVVNETIDRVKKIFKIPSCGKVFPRDISKTNRPCLNFHIKNCSAPCAKKISQKDYKESVLQAIRFLKTGATDTLKELRQQMETAAENLEFERAARLRDEITAIEKISDRQKIYSSVYKKQDIIALAVSNEAACFEVFNFDDGKLYDREEFIVDSLSAPESLRSEFIKQYYTLRDRIPPRITVDGEVEDKELIEEWLRSRSGRNVTVFVPEKGTQEHLVTMCRNNAAERLAKHLGRHLGQTAGLDELARLLGLEKIPEFIESYDISNTAGESNVAGMVVFKNGKPYKSAYRKFKIKSFEGQDDFRSMAEVIERRFNEYKSAESQDGFGQLPDLILLDGGKGQLSAVKQVLDKMGIDVPVFGMVKDSKHKTRAVTGEGKEIAIKANRSVYTLVSTIQEEVHRFAIGFHRASRSKSTVGTMLTEIEGVGDATAKKLLAKFKTVKALESASIEDLKSLGIPSKTAENIKNFFTSL